MYNTDVMRKITSKVHTICLIPSRNAIITFTYFTFLRLHSMQHMSAVDTYLKRRISEVSPIVHKRH
jgi:hypothetical protein